MCWCIGLRLDAGILCFDLDWLIFGRIKTVALHWQRVINSIPRFGLDRFRSGRICTTVFHWRRLVIGIPCSGRHRLRGTPCGGLSCRGSRNRIIRKGITYINIGLFLSGLNFFLSMRQFSQLVDRLLRGRPGASLGAVSLSFLPLPTICGVPELALQLFRTSEKAARVELLRRGLNLFFRVF